MSIKLVMPSSHLILYLHMYVCVCIHALTQLCPTLCDLIDCGLLGSSVHGISVAGILEWIAISSSRGSSQSGIKPTSPALTSGLLFPTRVTWEAHMCICKFLPRDNLNSSIQKLNLIKAGCYHICISLKLLLLFMLIVTFSFLVFNPFLNCSEWSELNMDPDFALKTER